MPAWKPSAARPPFILIVTGVFCLFGVMCFVGALQGRGAGVIHVSGALPEVAKLSGVDRVGASCWPIKRPALMQCFDD